MSKRIRRDEVTLNIVAESTEASAGARFGRLRSGKPKIGIMSRTHDQDLSGVIIECHPSLAMSMSALRHQEAWSHINLPMDHDPRATYTVSDSSGNEWHGMHIIPPEICAEHALLLTYIPWLDGAREALMNIDTALHGL